MCVYLCMCADAGLVEFDDVCQLLPYMERGGAWLAILLCLQGMLPGSYTLIHISTHYKLVHFVHIKSGSQNTSFWKKNNNFLLQKAHVWISIDWAIFHEIGLVLGRRSVLEKSRENSVFSRSPNRPSGYKFGLGEILYNVIVCAKCCWNWFRVFDFVDDQILAFPIGMMYSIFINTGFEPPFSLWWCCCCCCCSLHSF